MDNTDVKIEKLNKVVEFVEGWGLLLLAIGAGVAGQLPLCAGCLVVHKGIKWLRD